MKAPWLGQDLPVVLQPSPPGLGLLTARPGPTPASGAQASDIPDCLHHGWRVGLGTLDSCCGLFLGAVWAVTREHLEDSSLSSPQMH